MVYIEKSLWGYSLVNSNTKEEITLCKTKKQALAYVLRNGLKLERKKIVDLNAPIPYPIKNRKELLSITAFLRNQNMAYQVTHELDGMKLELVKK